MSRSWILLFYIFCMLKAVTLLAQDPVSKQTAQQIDTIKIRTSLVTVPVIVKDSQDHFVTGLSKDDFVVWENRDRQEVTNFSFKEDPINVALIFDTSPSTKEWLSTLRKYRALQAASRSGVNRDRL